MSETLSKMYLELAHVVPEETKTFRELALEKRIEELEAMVGCLNEEIITLRIRKEADD